MKNSIGLAKEGHVGSTNSEGLLICFVGEAYRSVIQTIRDDGADDSEWVTEPLDTLLIPGEFL